MWAGAVKPILGKESLSQLMSWEMEHIFAAPSKFSVNYRKEIHGGSQLCYCSVDLGADEAGPRR